MKKKMSSCPISYDVNIYMHSPITGDDIKINAVYKLDTLFDNDKQKDFRIELPSVSMNIGGIKRDRVPFSNNLLMAFYPVCITVSDTFELEDFHVVEHDVHPSRNGDSDESDSRFSSASFLQGCKDEILCALRRSTFYQHIFKNRMQNSYIYFMRLSKELLCIFSVDIQKNLHKVSQNEEFFNGFMMSEHSYKGKNVSGTAQFYYKYTESGLPENVLATYQILAGGNLLLKKDIKINLIR